MTQVERGEASIKIDLTDGMITVYHGTDGDVLHQVKNARKGSWDKLWKAIRAIKPIHEKQT